MFDDGVGDGELIKITALDIDEETSNMRLKKTYSTCLEYFP